ncbi:MAG TPA: O-antigen ligase family protein [Acidimicrobiales bacterium]|nr:O-antigen ligase family protein [Acidimicrobiales bacterium]
MALTTGSSALARRDGLLAAAAVVAALMAGYGLVAVAARLGGDNGPLVLLALVGVPLAALAVLNDPRLAPALVVLAFPVGVMELPGIELQLVQLATLAVAALVALRRMASGLAPLSWVRGMGWGVAFVAWMLVGLPTALNRQRALREIVLFAIGMVFAATVVAVARRPGDVRALLAVVVGVVAAVGLTTPLGASQVRAAFDGAVVQGRATGIFTQPNQLGTFCATGALIGIGVFFAAQTRRGRLFAGIGVAGGVLGLVLSLSRGSWIGFVLGAVVLVVKLPEARRALMLAVVPVVLLGAALSAFAPTSPQVEVVGQRLRSIAGERNPYDNRPAIWREAQGEIVEQPVTGYGAGSFPQASARATSKARTVVAEHAHNLLLTWGAELGLPALGLALGLAVHLHVAMRRMARRVAAEDRAVVAGLAAALVGVLGQGIVDYTLHNAVVLTLLFAMVGAVFAYDRITRTAPA